MSFTENTASPVHVMKTEKNSPTMIHRNLTAELAVVGGGLAGVCAAIAAARHGVKTVLIQDRPVLGGNASSEIRMGIVGAHGDENKETGILEELQLENIRRNPLMRYTRWDDILYSAVIREPNLKLLLNTSVRKTETNGKRIVAVEAWNGNEYCEYHISADFFADCSGDGILRLSGAEFRIGRELPGEFDEDYLKEGGDARTMGNSILLQLRKTEEDRPFLAPEWAYHFTDADFADGEGSAPGHHSYKHPWPEDNNFWWIEFGGNLDTIGDANAIQFELKRIAYGVWEYMKNHPDGRCRNYELDWIGSLPGKRESCRFVGDHILTQHDIMAGGRFDDVVCYGGWTLDDHHPDAFFHRGYVSTHHTPPSPFGIPFRCLYSRNIENLLFAGRNISCTHMGMSATRVMGTCALMGQVIGTAAGILKRCGITPRLLYQQHIGELQELLLEDDVMLPGQDGFSVCRKIREQTDTPIFFITARVMEEDELNGYAAGADDYITKPFSLPVLYAKVMAMTGRVRGSSLADLVVKGSVTVNLRTRSVTVRGSDCPLAPKEYEMLLLFLKNPNRVFTREQLLVRLWGYDFEGNERVVDNHIKKLRKALEGSTCRIHTVRNAGYRMEVSV